MAASSRALAERAASSSRIPAIRHRRPAQLIAPLPPVSLRSPGEELRLLRGPVVLRAAAAAAGLRARVQHAMAGNREGEPAVGTGPGDRADCLGRANRGGDLRVARGLAEGNLADFVPDPLLQLGPAQVQAQRKETHRLA